MSVAESFIEINLFNDQLELLDAAALEAGCTRLWSEDLQHGQRIERLTIENPFRR